MALINDVHAICSRLAPRGWGKLFRERCGGLDITKSVNELAKELERPLIGINRALPGLDDLSTEARKGITAAAPALSVLYHALASPAVQPFIGGAGSPTDYPSLSDLDVIENYIFSRAPRKLSSFRNPVVVVVACQYRTRAHTPHQSHADLLFSRTGVARVGTEAERYDARRRSFDPRPGDNERGFAAQPARYAAYVAEYGALMTTHVVLRPAPQVDAHMTFVMPVHKLFRGKECLVAEDGRPLNLPTLQFVELHLNEKLARIHRAAPDNPGHIALLAGFDLEAPPFVRSSLNANDLTRLVKMGDSVLVQPIPNPLVRLSEQKVRGRSEPVRFKVPARAPNNRYWSSLSLETTKNGRAAPEYANIRLQLGRRSNGTWKRQNLNQIPDPPPKGTKSFSELLAKGGYDAAHLIDNTCDGSVSIKPITGLSLPILPAYSLVTAIDFFPQVEQVTVASWLEKRQGRPIGLGQVDEVFAQGSPEPLSDGRFHVAEGSKSLRSTRATPNSQLPDAVTPARAAFPVEEAANQTATAVMSFAPGGIAVGDLRPHSDPGAASWLPDAASGYFAPGWDVSEHVIRGRPNYVAYGLGSPFPEDAKLCAALNSFWPAVAPDSSRTYGFAPGGGLLPTAIPLMDDELGYHPKHPRVVAGEVAASLGWDGDHGPFFVESGGKRLVNAMNPLRADLSLNSLDGRLGYSGLDRIESDAFLKRIEEMLFCKAKILPEIEVSPDEAWLVSAESVADWVRWTSMVLTRADPMLKGPGFVFAFAVVDRHSRANAEDPPMRLTYEVKCEVQVQLSDEWAFHRVGGGRFSRRARGPGTRRT